MQSWIQEKMWVFAEAHRKQTWRKSWTSAVAVLVIICTLYGLLLPAFTLEKQTYCGEDHEHTDQCYSDPDADTETASDWESTLPGWFEYASEQVAENAISQLGYKESTKNYKVVDDHHMGYSRYGAWYDKPYADWNTLFAAFCLSYADVSLSSVCFSQDAEDWKDSMRGAGRFTAELPKVGSIAFFKDNDRKGTSAGIVTVVDADAQQVTVVAGAIDGRVEKCRFSLSDGDLCGFGLLPSSAYPPEPEEESVEAETTESEAEEASEEEVPVEEEPSEEVPTEEETAAEETTEEELPEEDIIEGEPAEDEPAAEEPLEEEPAEEVSENEEPAKRTLIVDGTTYKVIVTFDVNAGIPEEAELAVREIVKGKEYKTYTEKTLEALEVEADTLEYIRLFDISIVKDGEEVQPAEGSAVEVRIELADVESECLDVVHFGEEPKVLEAETCADGVIFTTDGFSVYAIVEAPEPVTGSGWYQAASVSKIAELGAEGLYVKNPGGYYFTNQMYNVNASRTGIKKTAQSSSADVAVGAVKYYFEPAGEEENQFKAYCYSDSNEKLYVKQSSTSLSFTTEEDANIFTISDFGQANTFRIQGEGDYYWNMQGGNNGNGFAAWTGGSDQNARIQLEYFVETESDPYGLDGKTYGIAYHDESATSDALTAESTTSGDQQRLAALDLVMEPDVLDNDGMLLVAHDCDIQEFTFVSQGGDHYYITTQVDGETKYLTINGGNVTLEDEPDPVNSVIKAIPGTGAYAGKWHFTVGNRSLNFTGRTANGFNAATGNGASTWMNLVEKSILTEDDFTLYKAHKVSVSDTVNVFHRQQVVIYTRIWNDTTKKYEFYAVDHDGTLVHCYDTGDGIEWIGTRIDTPLWTFREGYNADGSLSYYYWLQNVQYPEKYLVPKITEDQAIYASTVTGGALDFDASVNLNGRRNGANYTEIICWDEEQYSYAGLKTIKTESGWKVVPCALAEAEDFYFAVMVPVTEDDSVSTVETIDSTAYGITLKMIDYNNAKTGPANSPRDTVQSTFFGGDNNNAGLLSTDLTDGYPISTDVTGRPGHSLSELFTDTTEVNHLFIQSIYNESGYFEYDSTSNFAYLGDNTNFTVYDQLGAIGDYPGAAGTGMHGQFMPYDELVPGRYCSFTNQTSVTAEELPDMDARKGERLYDIGYRSEVDYHFGMEMSASFTQTASGLDAWGHDIIFEFSGDDDFWFYVDDELVLDLGGVHSAMTGSINFRTGEVKSSRGNSTLYDIFKNNYLGRGMTEAEANVKLNEIFEEKVVDGQTVHVFKDYSTHTMRMFYMERGAGASNLHMRFNLAAVQPGSFVLSKKLSGSDSPSNSLIEFPYQIWYQRDDDDEWHLLGEREGEKEKVFYKDSTRNLKYAESFTPAGGTIAYEHVFFLKPGESADVNMPDDVLNNQYYVVECGINPNVYDHVYADQIELTGVPSANPGRNDYPTSVESMDDRPKVDFENHVKEGAMRTLNITKRLYDVDGQTLLHYPDNSTLFTFRLYLGNENTDADHLQTADLYPYYLKDPDGNYCRWDPTVHQFVSLGISEYSELAVYLETLTAAEREHIIFSTSMNGSISKIPADYTIEVRDLIVDTRYKVEERDSEIPRGYTLRVADGYTRVDEGHEESFGIVPPSDTIADGESPEYEVRNQKGWGLSIQKIWSDADFMQSHDPIYFAVYREGVLLTDKIKQLTASDSEVYFFFDDLKDEDNNTYEFGDYKVYEVLLTNPVVDSKGMVTSYEGDVVKVDEGEPITVLGLPVGMSDALLFTYTSHYSIGTPTGHNENVRIDTVTNSRPGIELYKATMELDEDGKPVPLAGAVFTLTNEAGQNVSAETYTSGEDGHITTAYLADGIYCLTETWAPQGYAALDKPLNFQVEDEEITILDPKPNENLYVLEPDETEEMICRITIKDRPESFKVRKVDADHPDQTLEGVHFALYRQVTEPDGTKRKDYLPMEGFEDLITDEEGILDKIDLEHLSADTYYLTETQAHDGYALLTEDLCFTLEPDGRITIHSEGHEDWLVIDTSGDVGYVIVIPNAPIMDFEFTKVWYDTSDTEQSWQGPITITLYSTMGGSQETTVAEFTLTNHGGTAEGYTWTAEAITGEGVVRTKFKVTGLPATSSGTALTYYVKETQVDGCLAPIYAMRTGDGETIIAKTGDGSDRAENGEYVQNRPMSAFVLPASGGTGTHKLLLFGVLLTAIAGAGLLLIRKPKKSIK